MAILQSIVHFSVAIIGANTTYEVFTSLVLVLACIQGLMAYAS